MANGIVEVTEYTDPSCPFAFSASPELLALKWFYGGQLSWTRKLVVLSETAEENERKGLTPDHVAAGDPPLRARYGMPLSGARPERVLVSLPIALAIKAAELTQPELADRYFRALQVAWHTDRRPIDEADELLAVASEVGLDSASLEAAIADPTTRAALDADKLAARSPLPAATGPLDHKLAGPAEERRYTCPSIEVAAKAQLGSVLVAPGMQNQQVYEALLANVAPQLARKRPAATAEEVLEWADWPLASAEVAAVMNVTIEAADEALTASNAIEVDGYWLIPSGDEDQLAAGSTRADRLVSSAGVV